MNTKKASIFIAATLTVGLISGGYYWINQSTKPSSKNEISTTTSKVGNIDGSLEVFPFEQSVQEADLITKVVITNKVKEINTEDLEKTVFEANILETQKNNDLDTTTINIMQEGNSEWSFNNNPMLEPEKEYILFLKKAVGVDTPNTYWILGEETNIYEEIGNGELVKWEKAESSLADIEKPDKVDKIKEKNKEFSSKEIQILDEDGLINKIKKIAGEKL